MFKNHNVWTEGKGETAVVLLFLMMGSVLVVVVVVVVLVVVVVVVLVVLVGVVIELTARKWKIWDWIKIYQHLTRALFFQEFKSKFQISYTPLLIGTAPLCYGNVLNKLKKNWLASIKFTSFLITMSYCYMFRLLYIIILRWLIHNIKDTGQHKTPHISANTNTKSVIP